LPHQINNQEAERFAGRVKVCVDVLKRRAHNQPGDAIPTGWWVVPTSIDEVIKHDTRLLVTKHIHEISDPATELIVVFEDEKLVIVDKPPGVPSLAGVGPGVSGENNCCAVLNRIRRGTGTSTDPGSNPDGSSLNLNPNPELFPVNRIDKPVSGL
jgi:23S rRNA-/tRNA-specific pseudouridylate synthase|tara:strand:- start:2540 stop:3004 length:465 start_codon:yes stop_codon:yes gene_type:complete